MIKSRILILTVLMALGGCDDYSHSKYYNFVVENHLTNRTVKIVPKSQSGFWIYKTDTFRVIPNQKIFIGMKDAYNDDRIIHDLYQANDAIEQFDVYIDNEKQTRDFTKRGVWIFSIGPVDESAQYTLIIDENALKNK